MKAGAVVWAFTCVMTTALAAYQMERDYGFGYVLCAADLLVAAYSLVKTIQIQTEP